MPLHRLPLLLCIAAALAVALPAVGALPPQPSSNCQRQCDGVDIPYPCGIGPDSPDHCAMSGFNLSCKSTGDGAHYPFYGNVQVLNISLQQGQARMLNHISSSCFSTSQDDDWYLNFTDTPYRFSDTSNKFTVIGCDTLAYIADENNVGKYMSGCVVMCRRGDVGALTNGSCSGIGCCQTSIPTGLQYYQVWFDNDFAYRNFNNVSSCSYAVLMDTTNFTFLTSYATSSEFNGTRGGSAPLVIDWAIGTDTCKVAQENHDSYACAKANSECIDAPSGTGYICNCNKGFDGNPYLFNGCTF